MGNSESKADIIFFGAHPDDIEIGAGGLIAQQVAAGRRIVMVDLTKGEMASTGTPEGRHAEAQTAARILGVKERINLGLPDSMLTVSEEYVEPVVRVIRRYRPKMVFAPYPEDRHPDHVAAGTLVAQAVFIAGLWKRYPDQPPHRNTQLFHYFLQRTPEPSFVVDISNYFQQKVDSLAAHQSQFGALPDSPADAFPGFFDRIRARCGYLGGLVGAAYGEGFYSTQPLRIIDIMHISY